MILKFIILIASYISFIDIINAGPVPDHKFGVDFPKFGSDFHGFKKTAHHSSYGYQAKPKPHKPYKDLGFDKPDLHEIISFIHSKHPYDLGYFDFNHGHGFDHHSFGPGFGHSAHHEFGPNFGLGFPHYNFIDFHFL